MRPVFFFLFFLALAGCHTGGPVEVDGVRVCAELRQAADGVHFDYTGYLANALLGDEASLEQLLRFDQADGDSLAVAGHGQVLKAVLGKAGDEAFAKKVATMPQDVKRQVWEAMAKGGSTDLKIKAPLTLEALLPPRQLAQHRGLYVFDAEGNSTFRDCLRPSKRYKAVDETGGNLEKSYRRLLKYPYPGQPIFAEVKGFASSYYGGMELSGKLDSFFVVTEIVELEQKNFRNTCVPYDLWALGTEPFWYAQVSEMEGVIEFRGMDDERTKVFAYQPSMVLDSAKIFAGINEETGDNIRISVWQRPCSDGMSETVYPSTVSLTVNGKVYKGCGIPFGTAVAEGQ